jgi:FAD/FMN-containing dehydrogenase
MPDVARAIAAARELGLEIAVRGVPRGHCSTEGGVVIDLRELKQLELDAAAGPPGSAPASPLSRSAALVDHGLAIGFGDTGSVGVGGITLGGGVGISPAHRLTIDACWPPRS